MWMSKSGLFRSIAFRSEDFFVPSIGFSRFDAEVSLGMVGLTGLEPVTPRLSSACSNQLSYRPLLVDS